MTAFLLYSAVILFFEGICCDSFLLRNLAVTWRSLNELILFCALTMFLVRLSISIVDILCMLRAIQFMNALVIRRITGQE